MEPGLKNELETFDVIVIDCDNDEPKLPHKNIPSKSRKAKREVTITEVDNLENIFITKKVHVKEQNIKCVINLTTNVCDSQKKCESREIIERILPKCFRPLCRPAINDILNRHCEHKLRSTKKHATTKKDRSKKQRCSSNTCKEKSSKKTYKKEPKSIARDQPLSISSVSLSPFVSDISYDDISLNSFSWCSESDEGDIDTLIRRARAREKRRCVTPHFPEEPLYASTPRRNIIELSDEEMNKHNESIHSLETFVLNPQSDHTFSSNVSSDCMEVCDAEGDIKNSLPITTIDLTDTKSDPFFLKKPSKHVVNNNNIPNEASLMKLTDKQNLPLSKIDQGKFEKLEGKTEALATSMKPFQSADCIPITNGVAVLCHSDCCFINGVKKEK